MNINEISGIGFNAEITTPIIQSEKAPNGFELMLSKTNHELNQADFAMKELASGKTEHLHETMIQMEQAKLSMQMLEQIRNRLMSAFQELMREQI